MTSQKQNVQTDGSILATREKKRVKFSGSLKFVSSLLLPLTLGVFTVVITFQQQSAAKQQRDGDREAAKQLRDQEKQDAELLRKQDKDLDKQRYENGRFDAYIQQMGKLLEKYHGSIKSSEIAATLARVKTLNIFRQLEPQRNVHIIRFLYEAKQLTDTPENRSIDLSTAKLLDIDFRDTAVDGKQLDQLSLTGIFLLNATFIGIKMSNINFSRTKFDTTNFSLAKIHDANFSFAEFYNTSFTTTYFSNTVFAKTTFQNVNFSSTTFDTIEFPRVSANFLDAKISNTNFHQSSCVASRFQLASLSDCNFWQSNLKDAIFQAARLNQVNFYHANLYKTNFMDADMANSELDNTLSIQDVILPNKTSAHDENLIKDGQADCNISHISGWTLNNGNITTAISNKSNSNCQFTLQSFSTGATMYQRVNLSDKWDSNLWTYSEAVLSAKVSTGVLIDLKGLQRNNSVSSKETLSKFQYATNEFGISCTYRLD
ncbi:unnamed protein product [Rotaria socialis]|uniref:Pentapeptide repeat-containing protein n=1 Tax=Rotaria socialis TaxID=392032 RepID=A0A821TYE6_9BILA|nr:unnamed protein product [Rotaria socialis]